MFAFRENPFFSNKELVKTYHLSEEDDMMLRKIESGWGACVCVCVCVWVG